MTPAEKVLWIVETRLAEQVTLEAVASAVGVSPFHLTRSFAAIHGVPLMRYLRARRLSEAAKRLARDGPGDILGVALDNGYGSHEAFTRAYRDNFGETPEETRSRGTTDHLALTEAIRMSDKPEAALAAPAIVDAPRRVLAGLSERHDCADPSGITLQWQRFGPHMAGFAGRIGDAAYGASYGMDADGMFSYLCGFEVGTDAPVEPGMTRLSVPPQRFAVFAQGDHISAIRRVIATIFGDWLPASGHTLADTPILERYGPSFDPTTGNGGFEIWLPIKA